MLTTAPAYIDHVDIVIVPLAVELFKALDSRLVAESRSGFKAVNATSDPILVQRYSLLRHPP
jgi:hypothetical protein